MVAREAGWKILASSSRVIRRVLEGGAGCERGGRLDRSRDNGECDRFLWREAGEEGAERGGEAEDDRFWVCRDDISCWMG